jgi:DNA-binding response OmpR family regulator
MTHNLLIVEDNSDIARLIQLHAKDIDCNSDIASSGKQAVEMFNNKDYQLVILDLMLPQMNGLEVCRQLRTSPNYVPILMLTAKSSEIDRVLGLEVGADDYITKPFSIAELMARIKAQFRRENAVQSKAGKQSNISVNGVHIDTARRQVAIDGKEVELTAKEFDLLLHFAANPGIVYTRMQLLEQVWGYHFEGYEHTVNTHINRLRAKIEKDPVQPVYILTVWGVGYRFCEA